MKRYAVCAFFAIVAVACAVVATRWSPGTTSSVSSVRRLVDEPLKVSLAAIEAIIAAEERRAANGHLEADFARIAVQRVRLALQKAEIDQSDSNIALLNAEVIRLATAVADFERVVASN